jgi:hypothetical protein
MLLLSGKESESAGRKLIELLIVLLLGFSYEASLLK